MINGATKLLGIIGCPVAHSMSPVMQNAALEDANLNYVYVPLEVSRDSLKEAVTGLRAANFRGWNVTIPHKSAIMPLLDKISDDAKMLGAVNTVVNDNGKLFGYNTDVTGFLAGLQEANFNAAGKKVCVIGAGGAARAVLWGLLKEKAGNIVVAVRDKAKGLSFIGGFTAYKNLSVCDFSEDEYKNALKTADLIVNTTPLGMYPNVDEMPCVDFSLLRDDALVYDVIYTPAETKLLRTAKEHNLKTQNGETMLVMQGVAAFSLLTGSEPNEKLMKQVIKKYLEEKIK
ncbi:MAG: shikimate dehydrogenase [Selenomonadaceae bacterium]|nr:shikimate dehydrogenase [Selenomonadaceae bacterium]